ncbi:uncharacterized protein BDW43DRAFT_42430 [Aspergillus alliaceus]|uniref:uncharacterized protein n=1 Tax=Petromyces alliaceus TaxID=209559 RepID=UPI0012A62597|nr:uncharacterized protein BDW43DRAFT_42430 [Aspergillus alliaceus]KAB8235216.1 hypothetical protein BDW43DRAFT_42430 [Aspergillus alliaceus]
MFTSSDCSTISQVFDLLSCRFCQEGYSYRLLFEHHESRKGDRMARSFHMLSKFLVLWAFGVTVSLLEFLLDLLLLCWSINKVLETFFFFSFGFLVIT